MNTLLVELANKEILTGIVAKRLREYISAKYPGFSPALRAGIFADAVNRIVSGKLPKLPQDRIKLFKAFLYGDAAKKQVFSIDCSDIFKSSIKLKSTDGTFIKCLKTWLEESLLTPVAEDKVCEYVNNACIIMDEYPDMDIDKVLESVERKVGDIRPRKRVISVIRINQASAVTQTDSAIYDGDSATVPDNEGAGKLDDYNEEAGKERTGEDWMVIRRKKPTVEIIADSVFRLASNVNRIFRKTVDCAASTLTGNTRYRTAAVGGLIAAALLCTFLSALYVNAVEKPESGRVYDFLKEESFSALIGYNDPGQAAADNKTGLFNEVESDSLRMRATAYDLSVASCGKDRKHPEYGITYSGTRAAEGRTVAVDPKVIPLGSSVRITFPEEYSYMDGIYVAEDTGRLIKGNSIDIFFGEDKVGSKDVNKKALDFGVQYVEVEIMDNEQAFAQN